jgi:hypothetical protein
MPVYTFECPDGTRFTHRLSIAEFKAIRDGEAVLLDEDDNDLRLVFDPGKISFTLKDGESGGWPSRTSKERAYRRQRYEEMGQRQRDHAPRTRLVPNHKGNIADKWADVQDYVRTTKGEAASISYDRLVAKERQGDT